MKDLSNLDVTVHSPEALDQYNEAVTVLCRFADPTAHVERMLAIEPTFAMGLVFNAHLALWSTDRADLQSACDILVQAQGVDSAKLNRRERMHLAALQAWVGGDLHKASQLFDALLIEYPTDLLALLSGHQIDFFVGDALNLRDRVARVLGAWDRQHPCYGYLLGMLAFGQEEAGHYELAEHTARQALARNAADIWGIHALAHALEMQNKFAEGVRFMRECEGIWAVDNGMVSHNAVHLDLFLLEANDLAGALDAYDRYINFPGVAPMPMVLLDGSSVLWRVYLEGHDVSARAQCLAETWSPKIDQCFYAFNDAHAVIAYCASGQLEIAERLVTTLRDYLRQGDASTSNHFMTREVGLPVCEAILAFAHADYTTSIDRLMGIKNKTHLFGGSLIQRDVFSRTLLEAAIRARQKPLASALISERLSHKPVSPYNLLKAEQVRAL
ncbi:tetratricopeptide repeat protein [Pseudomonas sp. NCHU5208]|uniref:tetratricopeptide repeat protein n=1 Tax=unclassified Pseudomonas TaxID=196821 RepID=UPI003F971A34